MHLDMEWLYLGSDVDNVNGSAPCSSANNIVIA